jgi:hypothetical protein
MLMHAERLFPFNHRPARDLVNAKPDPAVSASIRQIVVLTDRWRDQP